MRRAALGLLVAAGLAAAAETRAEDCYGPELLRSKDFSEPVLKVVAKDASGRLHFLKGGSDASGCPQAGEPCAEKSFVTPGDLVVATAGAGPFACATFTGPAPRMASTSGFLPRAALSDAQPGPPPAGPADWVGAWRSGEEKQIVIAASTTWLKIKGEASYGGSDPERVARGAVNTGSIEASAVPKGRQAGFAMGDGGETLPLDAARKSEADFCRVRLWRLGPYLVVADNASCGGMNVTFTGVYRRE